MGSSLSSKGKHIHTMCTEPMSANVHDALSPLPPPDKKHRNQGDNQASHLMSCFTTCTNTITSNVCVTQKGTTVLAPTPVLQSFVWGTHLGSILGTMHLSLHTILPCTSVSTPYCHAIQSPHHAAKHISLHTILPCP